MPRPSHPKLQTNLTYPRLHRRAVDATATIGSPPHVLRIACSSVGCLASVEIELPDNIAAQWNALQVQGWKVGVRCPRHQ